MRTTHDTVNVGRRHRPLPGMGALRKGASPTDLELARSILEARGGAVIDPGSFVQTATPHPQAGSGHPGFKVPQKRGR